MSTLPKITAQAGAGVVLSRARDWKLFIQLLVWNVSCLWTLAKFSDPRSLKPLRDHSLSDLAPGSPGPLCFSG